MDIRDFKAGTYQKGHEYTYFLLEKINKSFVMLACFLREEGKQTMICSIA